MIVPGGLRLDYICLLFARFTAVGYIDIIFKKITSLFSGVFMSKKYNLKIMFTFYLLQYNQSESFKVI